VGDRASSVGREVLIDIQSFTWCSILRNRERASSAGTPQYRSTAEPRRHGL